MREAVSGVHIRGRAARTGAVLLAAGILAVACERRNTEATTTTAGAVSPAAPVTATTSADTGALAASPAAPAAPVAAPTPPAAGTGAAPARPALPAPRAKQSARSKAQAPGTVAPTPAAAPPAPVQPPAAQPAPAVAAPAEKPAAPPAAAAGPTAPGCPPVTDAVVAEGRRIFSGTGNCYTCHGPDAKGTALAPSLHAHAWLNISGSYESIVGLVTRGVPQPKQHPAPMPPRGGGELSQGQVCAVAAYVYSLSH